MRTYTFCIFIYQCLHDPLALPSFPTRRSSDLHSAAADHRRCGAPARPGRPDRPGRGRYRLPAVVTVAGAVRDRLAAATRSEEHTSELQSRGHLVCRLLLEKKKKIY